ncbi:MAG: hypothetical protein LBL58_18770 [Tannerellaceae bacterium]|jgi:hypothetical protein|nr:hypothetical protein [Tannerellaceae bacterium]
MKNVVYLLIAVFLASCGGSGTNSIYGKTITEYLLKGKSNDLDLKVVEMTEQGKVTVADSIAYLTDEFRKDRQLIVKRVELAKKMTEELLSKTKRQNEIDRYNADIVVMNNRIDSLKNLVPDNLQGYDSRNANDALAIIVRCKYSVQLAGKPIEETFDFYLSPDGSKCYGKKGI